MLSELAKLKKQEVIVNLPKFKITTDTINMNEVLKALGIREAFSMAANFSGMDGTKMLYISAVLHKAFVEVNEEGTEAAAATVVIMKERGIPSYPVFHADRPFVFMIRDNVSESILFMGRVGNPALTGS